MMREESKKAVRYVCALIAAMTVMGLAACGSGEEPITSVLDLKSPGAKANGVLKPSVFCGWGSLWVPLEWGKVPEGTKELAIMLARFKYVNEGDKRKVVVPFADLVSKFRPSERQLVANVLPGGVSWSYFGKNCIPRRGQNLLLQVFALDTARPREMNKRLATRLTEEALADTHSHEYPRSPGKLTEDATAVGQLIVTYGRPPRQQPQ